MGFELGLFMVVAFISVAFAVMMIIQKNAVYSALFLIGNFGTVAFLFLMLDAPFISMVQVAVYAGAIMVLFLFVIMLLGAENTSDTTQRFRWLTGTVLVLAGVLLFIIGWPLASGGFDLPEYEGDDPQLRVMHASVDVPAVNVELVGADGEPAVLEDLTFGDVSDRIAVEPGEYTVTLKLAEGDLPIFSQAVTLEGATSTSAVAYGSLTDGTFGVQLVQDNLEPVANGETRIMVLNAYTEAPVALVDRGPRDMLSTRMRDVRDAEGAVVLDENEQPVQEEVIGNTVLVDYTAFGDVTEAIVEADTYNMSFINDAFEEIYAIRDDELPDEVMQLIVLAGEPPEFETDDPRAVGLLMPNLPSLSFGGPEAIGVDLFTRYMLPVQMVGMLLLVALVGVVVLSRPEGEKREPRQRRRRKVSRPLISVISQQTGRDVLEGNPQLEQPASGD